MTLSSSRTTPDIPGYEITRLIGQGGMGAVYLARQKSLNRPVAIKFLAGLATDPAGDLKVRFAREAEMMARVSHPNIVTIFDFSAADGQPYLVMEYVEAGDLRSRLVAGTPLAVGEVRAILGPVVQAIAFLHGQGIIHRDLKPENILMSRLGMPKITDFGIARSDVAADTLTRTGVALGTMGYVAPEQQYRLKVDERADQFSLAAIAYEMTTGRKPLGVFPPPSKLNPRLGRAADAALLKALSDDPSDRFDSIEAFGRALDRALSAPGRSPLRDRRILILTATMAAAALMGVGVLSLADSGRRSSLDRPRADPPSASTPTPSSIVARAANLKLVLVPSGEFKMGAPEVEAGSLPEERPTHRVRISRSFYLGETEVTVGQFRKFVEATGYRTTAETQGGGWRFSLKLKRWEQRPEWTWRAPGESGPSTDQEPVVQVSWLDAVEFCKWLTQAEGRLFRLPTEAEWEYACRAGATTRWSFGDSAERLEDYAWTLRNAANSFHPVGTRKPNAFGLHDMHGSVWEWCGDWVGPYADRPEVDPTGPPVGDARILRGGSFDWDQVERTRSASRIGLHPNGCYFNYGFRVGSPADD